MGKYRKTMLSRICLLLILLLSSAVSSHAEATELVPEVDVNKTNTLTVIFVYHKDKDTEKAISGTTFALHKVADLSTENGKGRFKATEDFATANVEFNGLTREASVEAAKKLSTLAEQKKLSGQVGVTDSEGKALFSDLTHGIYMIRQADASGTAKSYLPIEPYLVNIPGIERSEVGSYWNYDVIVMPKSVAKVEDPEPEEPTVQLKKQGTEHDGKSGGGTSHNRMNRTVSGAIRTGDLVKMIVFVLLAAAAAVALFALLRRKRTGVGILLAAFMVLNLMPQASVFADEDAMEVPSEIVMEDMEKENGHPKEDEPLPAEEPSEEEEPAEAQSAPSSPEDKALAQSTGKRALRAVEEPAEGNEVSFTVVKRWSDGAENHESDHIDVTLLRNGSAYKEARIDKGANWTYTFRGLPDKDANGKTYKYEIKERNFGDYDTEYGEVKTIGGGTTSGPVEYSYVDYREIDAEDEVVLVASRGKYTRIVNARYRSGYNTFEEIDCRTSAQFDSTDTDRNILKNGSSATSTWKVKVAGDSFTAYNNAYKLYLDESLKGKASAGTTTTLEYGDDDQQGNYQSAKFANAGSRPFLTLDDGKRLSKSNSTDTTLTFYRKTSETVTTPKQYLQIITNDKVNIRKQIDHLEDNEGSHANPDTAVKGKDDYRLYLDVSGGVRDHPIDVLLVVDNTASMRNRFVYEGASRRRDWVANELVNGKGSTSSGQSKADGLVAEIMRSNPRNKVGVITFCGPGSSAGTVYWPEDMDRMTADLTGGWTSLSKTGGTIPYADVQYKQGSGTNYMSALLRADRYFADPEVAMDGNDKYMIFISDGEPNGHMKDLGGGRYEYIRGNGSSQTLPFFRDYFVANNPEIKTFTIGIKQENENYQILSDMAGGPYTVGGGYYPVTSGDQLGDAFASIKESLYPADVKITDELSQYVSLNLEQPDLKVIRTYRDATGAERSEIVWQHTGPVPASGGSLGAAPPGIESDCVERVVYTPSEEEDSTGRVVLEFKSGYRLGTDNTFTLSYNIKVNDKAKTALKESFGKYPGKGDRDTDYGSNRTSSGQPGFVANRVAYAEYKTANDELRKKKYLKPVVQTDLSLGIKKLDSLNQDLAIAGVGFKLFKASAQSDLPLSDWQKEGQIGEEAVTDQDGRISFANIKAGRYILEETQAAVGYALKEDEKTWYVSYDLENGLVVYDAKGEAFDRATPFPGNSIDENYDYRIVNSRLQELPKTGGRGIYGFYLAGAFLLLLAALALRKTMKNS